MFCDKCQAKIDKGQVSDLDVDVMRAFLKLEGEIRELKDVAYVKSILEDGFLLVLLENVRSLPQQKIRKITLQLEEELGYKVRVVERSPNMRQLAAQLLAPVRVLGINTIWLPDGSEERYVRISEFDIRMLPAGIEVIEGILTKLYAVTVKIKPENET